MKIIALAFEAGFFAAIKAVVQFFQGVLDFIQGAVNGITGAINSVTDFLGIDFVVPKVDFAIFDDVISGLEQKQQEATFEFAKARYELQKAVFYQY